jgi:hypothetical protein
MDDWVPVKPLALGSFEPNTQKAEPNYYREEELVLDACCWFNISN